MARRQPFVVLYAPAVSQHLRAIDTRHHPMIRSAIREQLLYEPDTETRNRKPLKQPVASGADWELRLGPGNRFRVLYEVDLGRQTVRILAIGIKQRNRLLIPDEEGGA